MAKLPKKATRKPAKRKIPDAVVDTTQYVPAVGPKDARIVFIAEAPGADEVKLKTPLIGYSGQFFREKLLSAGISFDECYVTNTCKYRPPHNKIDKWISSFGNKNNCAEPVLAGIVELYCDLAEIVNTGGGNVFVPMGNVALWALTGMMAIAKRRASILSVQPTVGIFSQIKEVFPDMLPIAAESFSHIQGRKVVPLLHPANVVRQPTMWPIFSIDLNRVAEEATHPNIYLPQRTFYIDPPEEEATELARRCMEAELLGCDIETVGGHTYCVQFSPDPSWALVLTIDAPWKLNMVRMIAESDVNKAFTFGWFDNWFLLYDKRIHVKNYNHDLAVAARCAYADYPVGLDFQTSMQTREPYYKDERKVWDRVDHSQATSFLEYAAKDACVTREIAAVQTRDELSDAGVRVAFDHKMKLVPIAIQMMMEGIKINRQTMQKLQYQFGEQSRVLQEVLDGTILEQLQSISKREPPKAALCMKLATRMLANKNKNMPAFNVGSTGEGNMMDDYIYGIRGFKPIINKMTKRRTTDEEALKELYGDSGDGILLTMVQKRKTEKLLSTELSVKLDSQDRTYFSVNVCSTKSGRWTFTSTIPFGYGCNGQAWHPKAKEMVEADTGYVFGNFDLAQAEDRVVAYYANVQKKIWAFENGVDPHALTAQGIFGGTIEEIIEEEALCKKDGKQSPRRYLGKQSNHAYNYGEGPVRFWKRVNKKRDETGISITRKQSFAAKEAHGLLYPEVEWYQKDIDARLYRDRYLVNLFGWKRTFYGPITDEVMRDAYFWIPQSSVPWIIDLGMLAIRAQLPQVKLVLHGHDSIICQMPENEAEDLSKEIIRLMTMPIMVGDHEITIPVDGKLSKTWGKG